LISAATVVADIHSFCETQPLYLNEMGRAFLEKYPLDFHDQLAYDASAAMKKWSIKELKHDVDSLNIDPDIGTHKG